MPARPRLIAIDGPAAAGKGTLARRLAAHFGLAYLDTGLLYRAVGARVLAAGGDPRDPVAAAAAARAITPDDLALPELRTERAGQAASAVATIPAVRAALSDFQRDFAARPEGAVLDGRDIGTVICPDAPVKLYVTASAEVRAKRRLEEMQARGVAADHAAILAEVRARDEQDAGRAVAPMRPAEDALLLDTSALDPDQAFAAALALIAARLGG
ncbi:MAG: (d)CMP kinase [Alphaproteobacteria bacterium]|nr:(d)CMP kinase [Alphaproteobacteria bacterium]